MAILDFHNNGYDWLSNFYKVEFVWEGIIWPSSEHAYQAAKVLDKPTRLEISRIHSPGKVKKLGKTLLLREDWDEVRIPIMIEILRAKFRQNPELKQKLVETGFEHLEEGNNWGDRFWGVSPIGSEQGMNHLGLILMDLRDEFRDELNEHPTRWLLII